MKETKFEFNGYTATVITPDKPNGKWIWKTEFLHAFEDAETALLERGYTRVTYEIHNRWGSWQAIRLMHKFHAYVTKEFSLSDKCILFGFSRGGTYAFNYALTYPEAVEKIYLDAPVLDLNTLSGECENLINQIFGEFSLTEETIDTFKDHPINNLAEFFSNKIPLLIVAGGADEIVPFDKNSEKLWNYCRENGIELNIIVKPNCKHHPHSLEDVTPIIEFVEDP